MTSTCPLDSSLVTLFVPWKGKTLLKAYTKLANLESLPARVFHLMNIHNCDFARLWWYKEWFHNGNAKSKSWTGDLTRQFCDRGRESPLEQSFHPTFDHMTEYLEENCPSKGKQNSEVVLKAYNEKVQKLTVVMLSTHSSVEECFKHTLGKHVDECCVHANKCYGPTQLLHVEDIQWLTVLCLDESK